MLFTLTFVLTAVLLGSNAFAGVDFSMMGGQKQVIPNVPVFHSNAEVIKWCNQVAWSSELIHRMKNHLARLRQEQADFIRDEQRTVNKDLIGYNNRRSAYFSRQGDMIHLGILIMENIERGKDVGASFYAGSVPI